MADTFLLRKHPCWKTVCFSLHLKIPKGESSCLPSLLCVMPSTVWVVNKCHITFIPHWQRMMFPKESCSLKFLSKFHKLQTFPRKGALHKATIPFLNLFPRFHPCFTHLFPGPVDFPLPALFPTCFTLFFYAPLQNLQVNRWHPILHHFHHKAAALCSISMMLFGGAFDEA